MVSWAFDCGVVQRVPPAHDAQWQDAERSLIAVATCQPAAASRTSHGLATRFALCQTTNLGRWAAWRPVQAESRIPQRAEAPTGRDVAARRVTRSTNAPIVAGARSPRRWWTSRDFGHPNCQRSFKRSYRVHTFIICPHLCTRFCSPIYPSLKLHHTIAGPAHFAYVRAFGCAYRRLRRETTRHVTSGRCQITERVPTLFLGPNRQSPSSWAGAADLEVSANRHRHSGLSVTILDP